jgi:hypothetical protein
VDDWDLVMAKYCIAVSGCDDTTYIVEELDDIAITIVTSLAQRITAASTYGCMPTMTVTLATPEEEQKYSKRSNDEST